MIGEPEHRLAGATDWLRLDSPRQAVPRPRGPGAIAPGQLVAAATVPLDGREDRHRQAALLNVAVEMLEESVALLREQRIDQHRGVRRIEKDTADVTGPVGRALGSRIRHPPRMGCGPAPQAGPDRMKLGHATSLGGHSETWSYVTSV